MGYVAVTTGFFALGAYLGRNLSEGWAFVWFIVAFACLIGMNFAVRRSTGLTWCCSSCSAGARAGDGAAPDLLRRHQPAGALAGRGGHRVVHRRVRRGATPPGETCPGLARLCFWALIALIIFGIVLIFVHIPQGSLIYSVLGLVIFAGLTMFDFQRLRRTKNIEAAPLLAASIFLDALNVFLFFLRIFSRGSN